VRADQRAERSPTIRGQSFDGPFRSPGNPIFDNSPQGDPFNESLNTPPEGVLGIDIDVTEARTGRLMFGVGVNSDAGVVGSIVLSEQNFDIGRPPRSFRELVNGTAWRGGGQRFRLEAIPGSVVSRYLINWTDPYFLNTNYSLGVSGFFYKRFFHDWNERRGGGRLTVGKQLTPTVSISGAVRLEEVVISDPDIPTPALLAAAVGSSFLSTVRLSMAHDTRDSPFLPAEGHFIQLSYEQAFGNFTYPRAKGEARQYFTLYSRADGGGRHTLALSGQVAWTDVETPIFERYYAGGFQTFRGFEFRGVSPRMFGVRVGGRWMALGTVEYMAPLMANEMIQGVVFTDFGTVENDVGFDEFRATAGLGLRVTVAAMGPAPLAFDFAFPIFKEDTDDIRIFSFYVGMTR
jgi:outer membrane protein insertion porin family